MKKELDELIGQIDIISILKDDLAKEKIDIAPIKKIMEAGRTLELFEKVEKGWKLAFAEFLLKHKKLYDLLDASDAWFIAQAFPKSHIYHTMSRDSWVALHGKEKFWSKYLGTVNEDSTKKQNCIDNLKNYINNSSSLDTVMLNRDLVSLTLKSCKEIGLSVLDNIDNKYFREMCNEIFNEDETLIDRILTALRSPIENIIDNFQQKKTISEIPKTTISLLQKIANLDIKSLRIDDCQKFIRILFTMSRLTYKEEWFLNMLRKCATLVPDEVCHELFFIPSQEIQTYILESVAYLKIALKIYKLKIYHTAPKDILSDTNLIQNAIKNELASYLIEGLDAWIDYGNFERSLISKEIASALLPYVSESNNKFREILQAIIKPPIQNTDVLTLANSMQKILRSSDTDNQKSENTQTKFPSLTPKKE